MRKARMLLVLIVIVAALGWRYFAPSSQPTAPAPTPHASTTSAAPGLPDFLPAEARHTLALIRSNGPYPYRQDGTVFQNREGHLPDRARGYYHEYTVPTPGARTRGARRIVTGGNPPEVYYYTGDHYRSFRRFRLD